MTPCRRCGSDDVAVYPSGRRQCRACERKRHRARYVSREQDAQTVARMALDLTGCHLDPMLAVQVVLDARVGRPWA